MRISGDINIKIFRAFTTELEKSLLFTIAEFNGVGSSTVSLSKVTILDTARHVSNAASALLFGDLTNLVSSTGTSAISWKIDLKSPASETTGTLVLLLVFIGIGFVALIYEFATLKGSVFDDYKSR